MTKTIEKKSAVLIAVAFKKLPPKLTCPKCKRSLPRDNFGMRVTERDRKGLALTVRRQSYCTSCRSKV